MLACFRLMLPDGALFTEDGVQSTNERMEGLAINALLAPELYQAATSGRFRRPSPPAAAPPPG
jgi:hypothetical protein